MLRGLFKLEVEGSSRLPRRAPMVLAPNHASYLDPFAVAAALPQGLLPEFFWGGWTGAIFQSAWRRGLSRIGRAIPVDPERAVISSLALAAAVLAEGKGLVWFPEGERSTSGEPGEFRQGLGMLLEAYPDIPVVPVYVSGTHDAWPPQQYWPKIRPVRVRFGDPLTAAELKRGGEGEQARERITRALRDAIVEMASS